MRQQRNPQASQRIRRRFNRLPSPQASRYHGLAASPPPNHHPDQALNLRVSLHRNQPAGRAVTQLVFRHHNLQVSRQCNPQASRSVCLPRNLHRSQHVSLQRNLLDYPLCNLFHDLRVNLLLIRLVSLRDNPQRNRQGSRQGDQLSSQQDNPQRNRQGSRPGNHLGNQLLSL